MFAKPPLLRRFIPRPLLALTACWFLACLAPGVLEANLITNGDFSSGTSPWTLSLSGGASASLTNSSGWGYVNITNGGPYKASVFLKNIFNANLVAGTQYTISFSAKAAAAKTFDVVLRDSAHSDLWSKYGLSVGTSATTFSYTFTPTSNYTGAYLAFRLGSNAISFHVDNVSVDSSKLTWAPPALVNPVTKNLTATSNVGTLASGVDYIINLPAVKRTRGVFINGGRNVRIIGGHIEMPAFNPDDEVYTGRAIYIKNGDPGRIVHIEGVLLTHTPAAQADFVAIDSDYSIVQMQNCRAENLQSGYDQEVHADVIQPWGGVQELRVDRLTATSTYQGLQLTEDQGPCGSYDIRNVNLKALPEWYPGALGGYMTWFSTGAKAVPTVLGNVYIEPRPGRSLDKSVWPDKDAPDPNNRPVVNNNFLTWPNLPFITGGIVGGSPAAGDFVPAGTAGLNYTSPGYLDGISWEAEEIPTATASDSTTIFYDAGASAGAAEKLLSNAADDYISYTLPGVPAGSYRILVGYKKYTARGQFQLSIDGVNQGSIQDQFGATSFQEMDLGTKVFGASGDRIFTFTVTGKNASSSGYDLTFDYIKLEP